MTNLQLAHTPALACDTHAPRCGGGLLGGVRVQQAASDDGEGGVEAWYVQGGMRWYEVV